MSFLKKLFGGKNDGTKTGDGTIVYTYGKTDIKNEFKVAPQRYTEEIIAHFDKAFPDRSQNVFHEIISQIIHIDIHIMEPTKEDSYWILYTTGMSDLPMTVESGITDTESYQFGEVMMFLPAEWDLSEQALEDENNYWPIRLMKMMARFPHEYNTWLGYGHTVPNYAEYEPYAPNTGLNGALFFQLNENIRQMKTSDGNIVNFYFILPLYKEEMEYKLEYGMTALLEKLYELGDDLLTLNPSRRNTCKD